MPVYAYKALTSSGASVTGELAAHSAEELRHQLAGKGMLMQSARQVRLRGGASAWTRRSVSAQELLLFNQEFIALVRAGLPIPAVLELIEQRPEQPMLRRIIARVLEDVRKGRTLSEACAEHPEVFDSLYITSLKTGEQSGNLAAPLQRYQSYLRLRLAMQKKIQQALAYPVFLLIVLGVILVVMFTFVMPRFVSIYTDFGAQLPGPTRVLMHLVENSLVYIPALFGAILLTYLGYRLWLASERGRLARDRLLLVLPLTSSMLKPNLAGQIARMLATLLAGGMPLVEAMASVAESTGNKAISQSMWRARQQVTEGVPLHQALAGLQLFPTTALKIIQAGESAGNLDEMLAEVANYLEENMEHNLTRLMTFIEPLMLLLMGVFIGGIIIAMYLPIFSVAEIVQ